MEGRRRRRRMKSFALEAVGGSLGFNQRVVLGGKGDTAEHKAEHFVVDLNLIYANKFAKGTDEASATERITSDQADKHQLQKNNSSNCKTRTSNLYI
jgi:hypothetical protein